MREYASFFEWSDRQGAEFGVAESFVASLAAQRNRRYRDLRAYSPDPPDCVCVNEQHELVAIEISEVVCSEAAGRTAKGENVVRVWRPGELREHIARQVATKDAKSFHGGPYAELIVCLFTDEPLLTVEAVRGELEGFSFDRQTQVNAAYLLLSHTPGHQTYPLFGLPLDNAA
jgi:hypothetical protein